MDIQPPIECACGSQHFERVVVTRPGGAEYTTEFMACVECRVMFHCPEPRKPLDPFHESGRAGIGGPPHARQSTLPIPRGTK